MDRDVFRAIPGADVDETMKENRNNKPNQQVRRRIDDYVDGRLNREEIDRLWEELVGDEEALDYLKTVANLKYLAGQEKNVVRSPFLPFGRSAWTGAAAAVVLVLVLVFGIFRPGGDMEFVEPIDRIELDYYRSQQFQDDPAGRETVIREAIVLANRGEHGLALDLIDDSLDTMDDADSRAALFMSAGSILYNISSYEAAASRFEQIVRMELDDRIMLERAWWYLGNAYFQLNRLQEAKEAFRHAYDMDGAYRRVAERYLKAFPV